MNGLGLAASNPIRLLRRSSASPRRASLHPRGLDVGTKVCETCGRRYERLPLRSDSTWRRSRFCSRACRDLALVQPLAERFWARVIKGPGCWGWTGVTHKGYGQLGVGHRHNVSAHRLSWELANGPIPDGMHVLHTCDNPPCCNPAHLFLGTQLDNIADMLVKGRGVHPKNAKLTDDAVREIRRRWPAETKTDLGIAFGVATSTICRVLNGRLWRHVA